MKVRRFGDALHGIFAKARAMVLGAVVVASFVAPGAISVVQGAGFVSRAMAPQGLVKMRPMPDCTGGGYPC